MATEQRLPEVLVKEAIGAGLESPMRESILEAVEDAEGSRRGVSIPLVVGAGTVGAAMGYLLGSSETSSVEPAAESLPVETPDPVADTETNDDEGDGTGGSWLTRLLTLVAVAAAIAYLRRRRGSDDGWEPIDDVQSPTEEASSIVDTITDEGEHTSESTDTEEPSSTDDASDAGGDSETVDDSDGESTGETETGDADGDSDTDGADESSNAS
ncbi:MSCRAMM family adhesin SdrC [Halovivax cerinus]|uniref:MSCRAMM family adhesin SdrC n=1 Tax=Halovivax cerinus TaxID=1487865 RepID=A0ABD5NN55_9EURY|nr:MSCRAMM family adhesin SdrC [Halovivax cerinus]